MPALIPMTSQERSRIASAGAETGEKIPGIGCRGAPEFKMPASPWALRPSLDDRTWV
jgi:hypothetical protein